MHKSAASPKNNHPSHQTAHLLKSPPKKEFELLYRERHHLPSSQAYESIIFMKSKKCSNQSGSTDRIVNDTKKHQSVEELKKVIHQLEKELKTKIAKKHKLHLETQSKSSHLKSTNYTNNVLSPRKTTERYIDNQTKRKQTNKKEDSHKAHVLSTKKVKRVIMSSMDANTSQKHYENLDAKAQNRSKKTQKNYESEMKQVLVNLQNVQDYLMLQNNFVLIDSDQSDLLSQKIFSSRKPCSELQKDYSNQRQQYQSKEEEENSVDQKQLKGAVSKKVIESLKKQQRISSQERLSSEQRISSISQNEESEQFEILANDLHIIQRYMVCKVKIIQRWWKKFLHSQIEKTSVISQGVDKLTKIQSFSQENPSLFEQSPPQLNREESMDCSPIKKIENIQLSSSLPEIQEMLHFRQNTAKLQIKTQKDILQKLLHSNKITFSIYREELLEIDSQFKSEIEEVERVRKTLQKKEGWEQKIMNERQVWQEEDKELIQKWASEDGDEDERIQVNLNENRVVTRSKSNGCHYKLDKDEVSIYSKLSQPTSLHDEYYDDFQADAPNPAHHQAEQEIHQAAPPLFANANFKELLDQFKERQRLNQEIDRRAAIQMGLVVEEVSLEFKKEEVGINTSILSVHKFLLAFFKYYAYYYRDEFLKVINMPFGYSPIKRMQVLQGYASEADFGEEDEDGFIYGLTQVIPEEVFEDFYEKYYQHEKNYSSAQKANIQFQMIHNRAIFDSFNEALNQFRPYFFINGPPYAWNHSQKALTFYFIAEDNIQEVFEKTQLKVLKWASSLCGVLLSHFSCSPHQNSERISLEEIMEEYKSANHAVLIETREERLKKVEKIEVHENQQWCAFEEESTLLGIEVSELIFQELSQEFLAQYKTFGDTTLSE